MEKKMKKIRTLGRQGYSMVEVMVVIIIVSILLAVSIPTFRGTIIRSRMEELYGTVAAIELGERLFYIDHEFYAAQSGAVPGYELPYTWEQTQVDNFTNILGVDIPGLDSEFVYGVSGDPAAIYVQCRNTAIGTDLYWKYIEGADRGSWESNPAHPWARYLAD